MRTRIGSRNLTCRAVLTLLLAAAPWLIQPVRADAPNQPAPSAKPAAEKSAAGEQELAEKLGRVDSMVKERMERLNIPGYSLTIIKDGKVVFQQPYGFASLERREPVTNDTVFGLASLTKTFTALTLLSLVDQGQIDLDAPLSKYIAGLTRPYQRLTIRQLASMTGGVPKVLKREVLWKNQIGILDHTPPVSQPGSRFLYSNYSYRLIGSVIANVTGQPFLEVAERTIMMPLGMESTATTFLLRESGRLAQAYGDNGGSGPLHPIDYKNPAISFSAGMLASTANDLTRYVFALMERKIISPGGYQTLWFDRPPLSTGEPSPWAFGWHSGINNEFGPQRVLAMNGGTPGVASTIIILPETKSAVIALCNLRKPPVYKIAKQAARIVFGENEAESAGDSPALPAEEDFPGAQTD